MPKALTRLEKLQLVKLLQCVRANDRANIEKMVANGIPDLINYTDDECDEMVLGIAAEHNDDDMVGFLLGLGADPDVADSKGRTAVMIAARYGHEQSVKKLAEKNANMKLRDKRGEDALFYALEVTGRHLRCVDIILEHGADPNNVNNDGMPVLLSACETSSLNVQICLSIIQRGADVNCKHERTGRTAVMAAAASGSAQVVRALLEGGAKANINEQTPNAKTHASHEAAKNGHLEVLQVLSAFGANFDVTSEDGNTPIHLAASNGHGLCCRFLAQRGCNPKPKNKAGQVARALAKSSGKKEAMKECRRAERFYGKSTKNAEPWTLALYDFTCAKQEQLLTELQLLDKDRNGKIVKEDLVECLQAMSAPLPDEGQMTKILNLHDKVERYINYVDFVAGKKYVNKQYLMSAYEKKKKGGKGKGGKGGKARKTKIIMPICIQDEGERNIDGGPPKVFIEQHTHRTDYIRFNRDQRPEHLIKDDSGWYLSAEDVMYKRFADAVRNSDMNTLKDNYVERKEDINIRDKYYKTPLMVACLKGNLEVVKFLVDCGANIHATDNFKWTPLHFACHCGMKDLVEYLLGLGANIEATAMNGATPLIRAIESSNYDVVKLLLDAGAKLRVENRKGETPMDIAAAFGDYKVFELIKQKWDSLPPVKDKKGAKGRQKTPGSRTKSTTPSSQTRKTSAKAETERKPYIPTYERNIATTRSASALGGNGSASERENITYTVVNTWSTLPTSEELIQRLVAKRERFGWEADFDDFKLPYLKNVSNKINCSC